MLRRVPQYTCSVVHPNIHALLCIPTSMLHRVPQYTCFVVYPNIHPPLCTPTSILRRVPQHSSSVVYHNIHSPPCTPTSMFHHVPQHPSSAVYPNIHAAPCTPISTEVSINLCLVSNVGCWLYIFSHEVYIFCQNLPSVITPSISVSAHCPPTPSPHPPASCLKQPSQCPPWPFLSLPCISACAASLPGSLLPWTPACPGRESPSHGSVPSCAKKMFPNLP